MRVDDGKRILAVRTGNRGCVVAADDLRRRSPEGEVGIDRGGQAGVIAGLLREVPLLLEHVAVRLDEVARRADRLGDPGQRRPIDVPEPALGDLGWVGDRTKMSQVGRPMSGVGAGVSFLDGLFRFDVARGLYPRKQFRIDLYLESKF